MMEPWFAIINRAAGNGRCGKQADRALQRLSDAGVALSIHDTTGPGHASALAAQAYAAGQRRFLVVGGDGTSYEAINGLFPSALDNERPRLALLPLGTGNSFLRDFDITSTDTAHAAIVRDHAKACDVVRCVADEGTFFYINILSVGFTADVGAMTNRFFKPLGPLGYVLATLIRLWRLNDPVVAYRHDDGPIRDDATTLLSFSNSRYTGGTMMMAPAADATDGALDTIHVAKLTSLQLLRAFPKIFKGTHVELPTIDASRAKQVTFVNPPTLPVMIDGEVVTMTMRSLDVLPGALEIVV